MLSLSLPCFMPLSSAAKRRTGPIPAKGWIGARNYCAIRFLEGMDGAGWVPVDSLIAAMKHKPNMDELYEVVERRVLQPLSSASSAT